MWRNKACASLCCPSATAGSNCWNLSTRIPPSKNSCPNAVKGFTISPFAWTISSWRSKASRPRERGSSIPHRGAVRKIRKLPSFILQACTEYCWSLLNMKNDVRIGIIGGSGLYQMEGLSNVEEVELGTPFGQPSDLYRVGTLEGRKVAFLARHNRNHTILPSELNFRANIHGFKQLGVEWILSASAVGSLREDYRPQDLVVPDQFFDRTRGRVSTFFGEGLVAHVARSEEHTSELQSLRHLVCR